MLLPLLLNNLLTAGDTPAVAVTGQTPAGSSKKHGKKRFFVDIDGQQFHVNDAEDARQLLNQARAIAERRSEVVAQRVVKKLAKRVDVPKIALPTPSITASAEIAPDLAPLIADIQRLYQKAGELAELRLLLQKQMRDEDDEDDLLLLL